MHLRKTDFASVLGVILGPIWPHDGYFSCQRRFHEASKTIQDAFKNHLNHPRRFQKSVGNLIALLLAMLTCSLVFILPFAYICERRHQSSWHLPNSTLHVQLAGTCDSRAHDFTNKTKSSDEQSFLHHAFSHPQSCMQEIACIVSQEVGERL